MIKRGAEGLIDRIQWDDGSGLKHVLHSDIQGNPGTERHRQRMEEAVNSALTVKQLLSSLPLDDPDRLGVNEVEYGDRMFWGDVDGKKTTLQSFDETYLVSRAAIVIILSWDGEKYYCRTRRV